MHDMRASTLYAWHAGTRDCTHGMRAPGTARAYGMRPPANAYSEGKEKGVSHPSPYGLTQVAITAAPVGTGQDAWESRFGRVINRVSLAGGIG